MSMSGGKPPQPHQTITCQALLSDSGEAAHCGWLRKRSLLHKKFRMTTKVLPWIQKYVVLHSGSVYVYKNESGKEPDSAFSLYGYHQVLRAGEIAQADAPWVFKLVPLESAENIRLRYFSASAEVEQKHWMLEIKKQMIWANSYQNRESQLDRSWQQDLDTISQLSFGMIEKSVYNDPGVQILRALPPTPIDIVDEVNTDEEDADDYTKLDDDGMMMDVTLPGGDRRNRALPTPPGAHAALASPDGTVHTDKRPAVAPKPNRKKMPVGAVCVMPSVGVMPSVDADSTKKWSPQDSISERPPAKTPRNPGGPPPLQRRATGGQEGKKPPTPPERPGHTKKSPHPVESTSPKEDPFFPRERNRPEGNSFRKKSQPFEVPAHLPADCTEETQTFWQAVYWHHLDKDEANRVIQRIGEEGVFLIRPSDVGPKVLVVFAEYAPRKYRVVKTEDNQYYICKTRKFSSVPNMIEYYYDNCLPNQDGKLGRPYTQVDQEQNSRDYLTLCL